MMIVNRKIGGETVEVKQYSRNYLREHAINYCCM